jgi:hypothetical protein
MGVPIMDSVKIYVTNNKKVDVTCPKCQAKRSLDLTGKQVPFSARTSCACGHEYSVQFDKRVYYRKALKSIGVCCSCEDPEDRDYVRIVDISRSGLAFTKDHGRSLNVGEDVTLEFTLGETKVSCTVTVASVLDTRIGATFNKLDVHTQKVIGFFLMP